MRLFFVPALTVKIEQSEVMTKMLVREWLSKDAFQESNDKGLSFSTKSTPTEATEMKYALVYPQISIVTYRCTGGVNQMN